MKRFGIVTLLIVLTISAGFANDIIGSLDKAWGDWELSAGRLYQNNVETAIAKAHLAAAQKGTMLYEFNVRYEAGAEDQHWGFGIHVFVDDPADGFAWGDGNSYLLWLNYDANATDVTKGFSAQVYESTGDYEMDVVADIDLNQYAYVLTEENMSSEVPVKIIIDGVTGKVKVYDPTNPSYYWYFYLGNKKALSGNYVSLRTNSLSVSFGM